MRYMYPAIFTCKRDKHMIVADFPDIAGCRAYGHTMEEAMESAHVWPYAALCWNWKNGVNFFRRPQTPRCSDCRIADAPSV